MGLWHREAWTPVIILKKLFGRRVRRYGCAVVATGTAFLLTEVLGTEFAGVSPLLFAAVVVSAWYGGWGPGLLATVLSGAASAFFFIDPPGSFWIGPDDIIRVTVFVGVALLISSLQYRARRAQSEAEWANRAKDRFLALLSHELRNPLAPVIASASLLEKDPSLPESVRADLSMISRNVALQARLIDDLLDLSRIIAGKLKLALEPVNVHALLGDVAQICGPEAADKGVRLVMHLRAAHPHTAGDPVRLRQVFWNLVRNAVKFTGPGGVVTITTDDDGGAGGGSAGGAPATVRVEVSDTGVGIEPHLLSEVFKPFEQGGEGVTRRFGGLGLGLAIAKMLTDAHGGTITARSDGRGCGATFTVTLPTCSDREIRPSAAPVEVEVDARHLADAPDLGRRPPVAALRILLVEDRPDTRRALSRLLAQRGFDVRAAAGVREAMEAAGAAEFDVLLSDLSLPDGSGLDLMRELRGRGVRGIAISGYGSDQDRRRSIEAGYAEHLVKPVMPDALESAIVRAAATGTATAAAPAGVPVPVPVPATALD